MLLDSHIKIVASSKTIFKLRSIGISVKIGEEVVIEVEKLWENSNFEVMVKCDVCGHERHLKFVYYNKNIKKYNKYCCSNKCSHFKNRLTCLDRYGVENFNNPKKIKETTLERYGVDNIFKLESTKEKIIKTNMVKYGVGIYNNPKKIKETTLERYGVDNIFKLESTKEKIIKTNMDKYGCADARSSDFVKNKRKLTNLERYGFESYSSTNEYLAKVRETSVMRYGVESPNMSEVIKDKKIKSMLHKYGYISNSMSDESKNKLRMTNLEKYGVEYPMQFPEFFEKHQINSKRVKYYNDQLYYQSSYEKHFLDYATSLGILHLISRGFYVKYEFGGKARTHFPDFYINKYNLILEIKSSYYYNKYLDKNLSKMNRCVELGYNYLFLVNKNYSTLNEIIRHF